MKILKNINQKAKIDSFSFLCLAFFSFQIFIHNHVLILKEEKYNIKK